MGLNPWSQEYKNVEAAFKENRQAGQSIQEAHKNAVSQTNNGTTPVTTATSGGSSSNNSNTANSSATRKVTLNTESLPQAKVLNSNNILRGYLDQQAVDNAQDVVDSKNTTKLNQQLTYLNNARKAATSTEEANNYDQQIAAVKQQIADAEGTGEYTSFLDRIKNMMKSTATGEAASYTGGARVLYEAGQEARTSRNQEYLDQYKADLERATRDYNAELEEANGDTENANVKSAKYLLDDAQSKYDAMAKVVNEDVQQKATDATTDLQKDLQESSAEYSAKAKQGTGLVGSFLVDVGTGAMQLAGDAVLGSALGMNALGIQAARAFGDAAGEAQEDGASLEQQLTYGSVKAALNYATNKMFDGVAGIYGKGAADEMLADVLAKVNEKIGGNANTLKLMYVGMQAVGEGSENALEDATDPVAKLIYDKGEALKEKYTTKEGAKEAYSQELYDFLLGFVTSIGINGTNVAVRGDSAIPTTTKEDTTAKAEATAETSPTQQSIEQQATTETQQTTGYQMPTTEQPEIELKDILSKGRISNTEADSIANDGSLAAAFEKVTGIKLDGTSKEKRSSVSLDAQDTTSNLDTQSQNAAQATTSAQGVQNDSRGVTTLPDTQNATEGNLAAAGEKITSTPDIQPNIPANEATTIAAENQQADTGTNKATESTDTVKLAATEKTNQQIQDLNRRHEESYNKWKQIQEKQGGHLTEEQFAEYDAEQEKFNQEYQDIVTAGQRRADGTTSKNVDTPENNIDRRSFGDVADRKVKAFQYDHPQLHQYYVEAAQTLMTEVQRLEGQIKLAVGRKAKYSTDTPVGRLVEYGMTKPRIMQCLEDIINNNGAENYADAKRVEIVLNDMLTDGWVDLTGKSYEANTDYITTKESIVGAIKTDSWEKYLKSHETLIALGETTEEQLRTEWEQKYPEAAAREKESTAENTTAQEPNPVQPTQETNTAPETKPDPTQQNDTNTPTNNGGGSNDGGNDGNDGSNSGSDGGDRVPTQSRVPENQMTKEERTIEGLTEEDFTHEQRHDKAVNEEAENILATDGMEKSREYLLGKERSEWTDTDVALAKKIMTSELETARSAKTVKEKAQAYKTYAETVKAYRESRTETARSLRQSRDFDNSEAGVMAIATEALYGEDNKVKLSDDEKLKILDEVNRLYNEYDSMDKTNAADVISKIKELNITRKTYGLFTKQTSKVMSWALEKVAAEDGGIEFLNNVLLTQIKSVAPDYVKPTKTDAISAYRYLAMLSKLTTTMANLEGNASVNMLEILSSNQAALLDTWLSGITGDTRSQTYELGKLSQTNRQGTIDGFLRSFIEVGLDADTEDAPSKYNTKSGRTFKMTGNWFERFLSTWQKWENYGLVSTDEMAKGGTRAEVQEGIDRLKSEGKITDNSLDNAGEEAALDRTLQNDTAFSEFALKLRGLGDTIKLKNKKVNLGLGSAIMPFAKIPANQVGKQLQFTGGVTSIANNVIQLGNVVSKKVNGTLTAADKQKFVKSVGRTATGVELAVLGAAMRATGILLTDDSDDKDQTAQEKSSGKTGTQINVSLLYRILEGTAKGDYSSRETDKLYSLKALPVLNSALVFGSAMYDSYVADGTVSLKDYLTASWDSIVDGISQFPAVSTLTNMVNAFKYSDAETGWGKVGDAAINLAGSYVSSYIPNITSGIATGTDPYVRDTYSSDSEVQQAIDVVKSKIPYLSETLPVATDNFGNPKTKNTSAVQNFLNENFLAGNVNNYTASDVEQELTRLADNGYGGLFPSRNAPSKVGDIELTSEEKTAFKNLSGSTAQSLLTEIMKSSAYAELDDAEKSEVIADIEAYAKDIAKNELYEEHGEEYTSDWQKLLNGTEEHGAIKSEDMPYYIMYKSMYDSAVKSNNYDSIDKLVSNMNTLSDEAKEALTSSGYPLEKLQYAASLGVNAEKWYSDKESLGTLKDDTGSEADVVKLLKVYNNTEGSFEDKLNAIEAQLQPSDGGTRNTAVRRLEAYQSYCNMNNIKNNTDEFLQLLAAVKDVDNGYNISQAELKTAFANITGSESGTVAGLTVKTAYKLLNTYYKDDSYATQIDETYAITHPAKESEPTHVSNWWESLGKTDSDSDPNTSTSKFSLTDKTYSDILKWVNGN